MAFRAFASTSARRAGSCVGPLNEIVITCRWRFDGFPLEVRRRHVVLVENLRKLRHPDADEAGVAHHVQDVGERNRRERVPQIRAERPANVLVRGQAAGGAGERAGEKGQGGASCHQNSNLPIA